jgi:hypothetical protein
MRAGVGLLLLPVVLHLKQVSLNLLHKVPVLINRHPLADLQTAAAPLLLLVRVNILHGVPVLPCGPACVSSAHALYRHRILLLSCCWLLSAPSTARVL